MYENPKKFFIRFLLLTLFTFLNIVLLVILSGAGATGLIIALLLTIINAILLVYMLVVSILSIFKYFGSEDKNGIGLYLLNFIFALLINILFGFFYFVLIFAAMIPLLAFM